MSAKAASIEFHKYEGLGNDFVVVEADHPEAIPIELARKMCDRRRGIGGDGVLLVLPPRDRAAAIGRMIVINADGSVPEMCGNGLRCVALHVARKLGGKARSELVFETDAGPKACVVDRSDETVSVDMGVVRWLEDIHLEADGETWDLSLADAGNPHAITRKPAPRSRVEVVGPVLATHPRFPQGTNVEFATVRSPTEIDLVVWERGVGITDACGTGACATVVVGVQHGWAAAERDVLVRLPGGVLYIRVDPTDPAAPLVRMTGPARHVFSGRYDRRPAP